MREGGFFRALSSAARRISQRAPRPRCKHAATGLGLAIGLPCTTLLAAAVGTSCPDELLARPPEQSIRYEDRQGNLLREVRAHTGLLSQWTPIEQVPKLFVQALIAIEDRRFYFHPGVDALALIRAAWQDVYSGRVISGASTLSMQLARLIRPHPRTLRGKFMEMALALRIEAKLSKRQILEQYLNRADFGPNLRGLAAASLGYFGKPCSALSNGELTLLAGLPQSPSAYSLALHPERAVARRARVVQQLVRQGILLPNEGAAAMAESVARKRGGSAFGAPHLVSALNSGALATIQPSLDSAILRTARRVRTTLDSELQNRAEVALSTVLDQLRSHHVTAGAVLVVDNSTGDILAYVGSPNFYAEAQKGQIDGVRALRQPGSTLKPFVYAAAFERLGYTAATVLSDLPLRLETQSGSYQPRNFDDQFRGPVRLREALGNSLNIPAVETAAALGGEALLETLHRLGFQSLRESPDYYGPALALGDGEVTLLELVRAYVSLARGGVAIPLRVVTQVTTIAGARPHEFTSEPGTGERVLPESTVAVLTDILKDSDARVASFGHNSPLEFRFDVATKTGTSKGFRDNWVVGYTSQWTAGVWVGNFDGTPMQRVGGITGAAPVFHALLEAASPMHPPDPLPLSRWLAPEEVNHRYRLQPVRICPLSGGISGPHCPHAVTEFIPTDLELPVCNWHRELALDKRNGLLAGPSCPSAEVATRTFEVFPDKFANWAKSVDRLHAPTQESPNCPQSAASVEVGSPQIVYPKNASRFVIDPERPQRLQELRIEVVASNSLRELSLWVDGREYQKSGSPFEFRWPLLVGHHRLSVVTREGEESKPVEIDVR